jgi:membrane protein
LAATPSSSATERRQATPARRESRLSSFVSSCKAAAKDFLADDCMGLAQQIAYSSLLAFFPAVVALAGLLGLIDAYDELKSFLEPVAPQAVVTLLDTFGEDSGGSGSAIALGVGIAGAIWAASGAMSTLVKAVNRAWDLEESRGFVKLRVVSTLLVFAFTLVMSGMLLLIVLGGTIGDAIAERAHLGGAFDWAWNIARWPIAFAAVVALFAIVYFVAPNKEGPKWRYVSAGSVLGGLLWLALSGLLALYTSYSDSYTKTYGALAGGIVLLLWLNYSAWAILFGAELNSELDKRKTLD